LSYFYTVYNKLIRQQEAQSVADLPIKVHYEGGGVKIKIREAVIGFQSLTTSFLFLDLYDCTKFHQNRIKIATVGGITNGQA